MSDELGVACIGLGKMGSGIAENVLRAGFATTVWNRSPEKAQALAHDGARVADSPRAAAAEADVVVSCLFDDESVLEATLGEDGILAGLAPGAVHAGTTTISPATTRRLAAAHAQRDRGYVAAHVLGRPEAARSGELIVFAGGADEPLTAARPVLDAFSSGILVLGTDPALASHAKLAANATIVATLELLGEVYAWTEQAGIERHVMEQVLDALLSGPGLPAYNHRVAERSFEPGGFTLEGGLKDARLMLAAGNEVGVELPVVEVVRERLQAAVARGMADLDWSALTELARPDPPTNPGR
ncbi:MAG: 3-hydroxyisobutyrate dehydrogenase [Acidimicrobiales bacterium]|nr:3-hydroxyisobutyrate dehydrogenase [Acidimicrobiales bacterium]